MTIRIITKHGVRILLIATLVGAGAARLAWAGEPNEKDKAEYNKSMAAVYGGIATLKNADANYLKAVGEHLQKLASLQQLQEQVRQAKMANDLKAAQDWYAKRKLSQDYRKTRPVKRAAGKKLEEIAHNKAPARLTAAQIHPVSSQVNWPPFLTRECFAQKRAEVEQLVAERTPENSGLGSQNCRRVQQAVAQMKEILKDRIQETSPTAYLEAKKFLESLAFESHFVCTAPVAAVASK